MTCSILHGKLTWRHHKTGATSSCMGLGLQIACSAGVLGLEGQLGLCQALLLPSMASGLPKGVGQPGQGVVALLLSVLRAGG